MKRILALLLCITILPSICISAYAEQSEKSPTRSPVLIDTCTLTLTQTNNGLLYASAAIRTNTTVEQAGFTVIRIEVRNGTYWTSVAEVHSVYLYNASINNYLLTYQGTQGRQYRAYAKFYAYDNSISDLRTKTSSTISVP